MVIHYSLNKEFHEIEGVDSGGNLHPFRQIRHDIPELRQGNRMEDDFVTGHRNLHEITSGSHQAARLIYRCVHLRPARDIPLPGAHFSLFTKNR